MGLGKVIYLQQLGRNNLTKGDANKMTGVQTANQKMLPKALRESRLLNTVVSQEQASTSLNPSNHGYSLQEVYNALGYDSQQRSGGTNNGPAKD